MLEYDGGLVEIKNEKEYKDGWYYLDECEQLNGPFETKEKAAEENQKNIDYLKKTNYEG